MQIEQEASVFQSRNGENGRPDRITLGGAHVGADDDGDKDYGMAHNGIFADHALPCLEILFGWGTLASGWIAHRNRERLGWIITCCDSRL
ncbi:hypothetical protein Asbog_02559 [Asaia bogorensis NBRC 16594]|nr:hypothetical protein Asbog_02559 [Asaia bogorensis NBRC 16594]